MNLSEHKLSYESLQHCEISTLELGILIGHEYNRVNCLVDGPGKPKASTRTIQIENHPDRKTQKTDIYLVHFSSICILNHFHIKVETPTKSFQALGELDYGGMRIEILGHKPK